jgi:hypothetical protein
MESLSGAHWAITLIVVLVMLAIYLVPIVTILRKAGYSGWWSLLVFVPLVNIIMLWVFAFAAWPNLREQPR